ncbi:MAG: hypothetical protein K2N48_02700 [Muribaculaceae bacterium]|nr:hypothetical protein [Muribaculaceae bacterium]
METKIYRSRVDWWVYAIIPFTVLCCMTGPILTGSYYWLGVVLSVPFCLIIFYVIISTKYAIRGNELGVKGLIKIIRPQDIEIILTFGDFAERRKRVYCRPIENQYRH